MFDLKNDVLERLISLYNTYEVYVLKHRDSKINILIQDSSICFYLYNDKESLDEFIISFSSDENKLYQYLSVSMLMRLMKDMVVYHEDNEFYNNIAKPYLRLIVNDENMYNIMNRITFNQYYGVINEKCNMFLEISDSVPISLIYPFKFMKRLDERINLTKKLLKNGDR